MSELDEGLIAAVENAVKASEEQLKQHVMSALRRATAEMQMGIEASMANDIGWNIANRLRSAESEADELRQKVYALTNACQATKDILEKWGPERWGSTLELLHEKLTTALAKARGEK